MDHEEREEREVVKKKESRHLITSFRLVNAYVVNDTRVVCGPVSRADTGHSSRSRQAAS